MTKENEVTVETVPAIAGYRAGSVRLSDGQEVVVSRGPNLIEGVEGEWPTIRALIEGLLDIEGETKEGTQQSEYFYAWCQVSYQSLKCGKPGSFKPGHALVIAGPGGSGKSLLQVNVITPLLGGRCADPTGLLSGRDGFNCDLIGSEHLMMEELPMTKTRRKAVRERMAEAIKRIVASDSQRLLRLREDPITVQPFWRLTISTSNDPDKMRAFPLLTPDLRDKVVMLLAHKRPMPMPTTSAAEQAAFVEQIAKELPAYVDWLMNEYQIPDALLVDEGGEDALRFGFEAYQHPALIAAL